jgi:hypothetical protein
LLDQTKSKISFGIIYKIQTLYLTYKNLGIKFRQQAITSKRKIFTNLFEEITLVPIGDELLPVRLQEP